MTKARVNADNASADIQGVTAGTGLTGGGTSGTVTVSLDTSVAATLTDSQTLTNKTVALGSNTVSGTLAEFNTALTDADFVSIAGAETLTNKTINSGVLNSPIVKTPEERTNLVGTGFTGYTYNVNDSAFTYIFANSTANGTINFRSNASTTLNDSLVTGDSVTCALLLTNGATAYYPNSFQVDGSSVTPKWSGGTAPSAGNASSIDAYSFTIIKTANATFTVLAAGPIKYA